LEAKVLRAFGHVTATWLAPIVVTAVCLRWLLVSAIFGSRDKYCHDALLSLKLTIGRANELAGE